MFRQKRKRDFERVRKTLMGGKADCVPLIELGIHPVIKEKILGRPLVSVKDDIEFMDMMGYDFVKIQPAITFELEQELVEKSEDGTYKNAPDRAWAPEHGGIITTMEDLNNYNWPKIEDISYQKFDDALPHLPKGMKIIGQYGDIFTLAWELMGFETFALATFTDPELVKKLLEKIESIILPMFKKMATLEQVGALWYSDDIAYSHGLMMSPDFYREYFFPFLKRIGDIAKGANLPFIYHTDGILYDVFDDIIESGVNAQHPIEPKAMDIAEVKKRYGKNISLCGGIEVDVLSRGTTKDVEKLTLEIMAKAKPNGGWCAGSSNSVPDYVPVENYIAMVNTVIENGDY